MLFLPYMHGLQSTFSISWTQMLAESAPLGDVHFGNTAETAVLPGKPPNSATLRLFSLHISPLLLVHTLL